jgi:hypothetical protein
MIKTTYLLEYLNVLKKCSENYTNVYSACLKLAQSEIIFVLNIADLKIYGSSPEK